MCTGDDGTVRLWDARHGTCLRSHAAIGNAHATWIPATSTIVEASEEAWRWLQWQVWEEGQGWMPVPLETFGPPPAPRRLATT